MSKSHLYKTNAPTNNYACGSASKDELIAMFEEIAANYDRFNLVSSLGLCRSWAKQLINLVPEGKDVRVLDLAAGTGDITLRLSQAKSLQEIICTDITPGMLEVAKKRLNSTKLNCPVHIEVQDAQNVSLPDASFDIITMAYGIRNVPDRRAALREAYRLLKAQGRFLCLEFSQPHNPLMRFGHSLYLEHILPLLGGLITQDRQSFTYLASSIHAFPSPADFAHLMQECGFDEVHWQSLHGNITCIHTGIKY